MESTKIRNEIANINFCQHFRARAVLKILVTVEESPANWVFNSWFRVFKYVDNLPIEPTFCAKYAGADMLALFCGFWLSETRAVDCARPLCL